MMNVWVAQVAVLFLSLGIFRTNAQDGECSSLMRYHSSTGTGCGPCFEGYKALGMGRVCRLDTIVAPDRISFTEMDVTRLFNNFSFGEYVHPVFVDIDGDGDLDAFVIDGDGGLRIRSAIRFFRNYGSASAPDLVPIAGQSDPLDGLTAGYANVIFADIDSDGDFDAVLGNMNGFKFLRNKGNATFAIFEHDDTHQLNEMARTRPEMNYCRNCEGEVIRNLAFVDIDGDGDLDAFVGGWLTNIVFFRNIGNSTNAVFELYNSIGFPGAPYDVLATLSITFVDFDQDGDLDAFVGGEYFLSYDKLETLAYFKNIGHAGDPSFIRDDSFRLANIGAHVTFADIDGDSDLDAFVGGHTGLSYLHNNGLKAPKHTYFLVEDSRDSEHDPPLVGEYVLDYDTNLMRTRFVDLDGDGDLDKVQWARHGGPQFFLNNGSLAQPNFVPLLCSTEKCDRDHPFSTLPRSLLGVDIYFGTMHFVDLDSDGDMDLYLLVQNSFGGIRRRRLSGQDLPARCYYGDCVLFFRNDGSATKPQWTLTEGEEDPFAKFANDVKDYWYSLFLDADGDGDIDIFWDRGSLQYFENVGNSTFANFTKSTNYSQSYDDVFGSGTEIYPYNVKLWEYQVTDLDHDGDLDVIRFVRNLASRDSPNSLDDELKYFRNDGNLSHANFTLVEGVDNPFSSLDIASGSRSLSQREFAFQVVDVDGDGDMELYIEDLMFTSTQSQCLSSCAGGRGLCGGESMMNALTVTELEGIDLGQAINTCSCGEKYSGLECEQCASKFYGPDCSEQCPANSKTNLAPGAYPLPKFPTVQDCECFNSFQRVDRSETEFSCECPTGFYYDGRVACIPCGEGTFKPNASLDQVCVSCLTVLGTTNDIPESFQDAAVTTSTTLGAADSSFCICANGFEQVAPAVCGCPLNQIFDIESASCICKPGFQRTSNAGACSSAGLTVTTTIMAGVAALLLGSLAVFGFTMRKHIPYFLPIRLPLGCKHHFFLSYKQSTGSRDAHAIYHAFNSAGINVWMDVYVKSPPRSSASGGINYDSMVQAVCDSAVYVLLLTPHVLESDAVLVELAAAIKHEKPIFLVHTHGYAFGDLSKVPLAVRHVVEILFKKVESCPTPLLSEDTTSFRDPVLEIKDGVLSTRQLLKDFLDKMCNKYRSRNSFTYKNIAFDQAQSAFEVFQPTNKAELITVVP